MAILLRALARYRPAVWQVAFQLTKSAEHILKIIGQATMPFLAFFTTAPHDAKLFHHLLHLAELLN